MASNTFDPLALVKAMGHQTDPYSWAQNFSKSVDAKQALMTELANKMDIAEMGRDAQIEAANIRARSGPQNAAALAKLRADYALRNKRVFFDLQQEHGDAKIVNDAVEQGQEVTSKAELDRMQAAGTPGFNRNQYRPITFRGNNAWYIKVNPTKPYQRRVPAAEVVGPAPVEDPPEREAPSRGYSADDWENN